jgi:hypothetical protein
LCRGANVFDNKYLIDLVKIQTLFTSNHSLLSSFKTKKLQEQEDSAHLIFSNNQTLFFQKFRRAILKMGQLGVLTDKIQGEICSNCSTPNPHTSYAWTLTALVDHNSQILDL